MNNNGLIKESLKEVKGIDRRKESVLDSLRVSDAKIAALDSVHHSENGSSHKDKAVANNDSVDFDMDFDSMFPDEPTDETANNYDQLSFAGSALEISNSEPAKATASNKL